MTLTRTGEPIDPAKDYTVAGWASINEGTEGPPIWEVVEAWLSRHKEVEIEGGETVRVKL